MVISEPIDVDSVPFQIRGQWQDVTKAVKDLLPGKAIQVDFDSPDDAKRCRSSVRASLGSDRGVISTKIHDAACWFTRVE